eukprot:652610-Pyramimonas_sp.AAC.1
MPSLSAKMLVRAQRRRDKHLVPKKWRSSRAASIDDLPRAYLAVKGNCLDPESGALVCAKQHAH